MSYQATTIAKYANVQMAAEALLERFSNQATAQALESGNQRSSKFTRIDAGQGSAARFFATRVNLTPCEVS
jgi:hypothetical protein